MTWLKSNFVIEKRNHHADLFTRTVCRPVSNYAIFQSGYFDKRNIICELLFWERFCRHNGERILHNFLQYNNEAIIIIYVRKPDELSYIKLVNYG